ncbi:MAG: membrane integrity-associated transporter subunit PqiC [Alphaproteobacteria bacterium]|nr:membrane integrity-associated transporter subunit PqiC [Alphaproteobacteria bacterium]
MRTIHLSRRTVAAGIPGLVLAACSDIIGPPPAPKLYILRPALPPPGGPKVPWALAVAMPSATAGLDSSRIAITRPPNGMDYYADAAWPDRATALVQTALVDAFEATGRIAAVSRETDAVHADYVLIADLQDFEARYDQPEGSPTAVVRLDVRLVNTAGRNIMGHVLVTREVQATANSVPAAVEALDSALSGVLAETVQWTLAAAPALKS